MLAVTALAVLAGNSQAQQPAAFNVRFEKTSYSASVNSVFKAKVLIDPVPAPKLFSYGIIAQITGSNGVVGIANLTPVAALDFNGPEGAGALFGTAIGVAGLKGTSDFFTTALPSLTDKLLATLSLQPLPSATYTISLFPYRTLGNAEQLFVTGDLGVSDDKALFFSTILQVFEIPGTVQPTGALATDRQTGLLKQIVRITNTKSRTPGALRLWIDNVPAIVTVWNAHGNVDGRPYIDYLLPLAPGKFVDLTVEFYPKDRATIPVPQYVVEEIIPPSATPPTGPTQSINPRLALANGDCLLELPTVAGTVYYVQYSADLVTWKTAQPAIMGTGTKIQWFDTGPPRTDAKPSQVPTRFYRVVTQNPSTP